LAERTVKVNLVADVSRYTEGLARAATETRGLSDSVDAEFKKTETKARVSGERTGGTLAKGINLGLTRNSPLIVAGIAGALAAGAPAVSAGAATLFAGVGAVSAAQTQEVRRAWTSLGQQIRDGAVADSAYLVPVFTHMATQLADTFESLRPQLRSAFIAVAPQIDMFTDSLTKAASTAVPALVRAVQSGTPVIQGLSHLVETIGNGLADFLDAVSSHSQAAGTALAAIGDIVGNLLPVLGEFLGAGVELASTVLPPLASVLGVVADLLKDLEPILPGVAAGFAAFKIVSSLSKPLDDLVEKFGKWKSALTDAFSRGSGTATDALSLMDSLKGGMTALGLGAAAAVLEFAAWRQQIQSWGQALAEGGRAAEETTRQIQELEKWSVVAGSGVQGFVGQITGYSFALNAAGHASEDAAQAQRDYEASLDPVQAAQLRVTQAQHALNDAIAEHGRNSPQAISATAAYKQAQADLEFQEGQTELAISGVTQAMIDQYNQALAATNSSFAYRDAQNSVEDAQSHLIDVQNHLNDTNDATRTSTEDVERAGLQLEEALLRQATAAGQLASDALPASATELDHNTAAAQGTLQELYKMRDQMGSAFPASLQTTISNLEATGVHLDTTRGQAQNLSTTVGNIPTYVGIHVDADLGPAEQKLSAFINRHWSAIISTNVEGSGGHGGGTGSTTRVLATGGFVSGPGSATSDSIPARLSNGEFVVNAAATSQHRTLLESINARKFASGGYVGKDWTKIVYDADMSGAEAGMLAAQKAAGAAFVASVGAGAGGGVARWSNLVLQALAMEGQPSSLLAATLRRMNQESGGNPRAINLWDSNAKRGTPSKGLMQVIDPTFRAYHDPRTSWDIYDPLANVAASMRYAMARYGSLSAAYNRAGGYQLGTPFVPTTDAYLLHKGERVLTARENEAYSAGLRSRETSGGWGGGSSGGGSPTVAINARVFIGDREITDIVRTEATLVAADAVTARTDRIVHSA
jgi:hypothetical protein